MLELIILVLAAISLFAFLKVLHPEDRGVIIKGATNVATTVGTYSLVTAKGAAGIAYDIGAYSAASIEEGGQESLNAIHEYNKEITAEGGAIKSTVRVTRTHSDIIGVKDMRSNLSESTRKLVAANKAARANRTPRV